MTTFRELRGAQAYRVVLRVVSEVLNDQVLLRAAALTYVTLLSLVPILALAISIINVFEKSEGLTRLIVEQIAAGSPQTVDAIVEVVNNANFAGLGTIGGGVAFATTILAIGNVEQAFNQIWGIRQQRTWVRRFSDYLTVLIVAPLLLTVSISLGTTMNSQVLVQKFLEVPFFAKTYHLGLQYVPLVTISVAFALLYLILPNTRVRVSAAATGGLVAGILFGLAQNLYVGLNVGGAKYSALFGGMAFLPLLFAWIYICWVVVLLGAAVAYVTQNFARLKKELHEVVRGDELRESLGLEIAIEVARRFRERGEAISAGDISERLVVNLPDVQSYMDALRDEGVVALRGGSEEIDRYQLARPAERVRAVDVWRIGRGMAPEEHRAALTSFVNSLRDAEESAVGGVTLAELADAQVAAETGASAAPGIPAGGAASHESTS